MCGAFLFLGFLLLDNLTDFLDPVRQNSLIYFWQNSIIYGGIYGQHLFGVAAAIPMAECFVLQYEHQFWTYSILRQRKSKYIFSQFLMSFICGFSALLTGGLLFTATGKLFGFPLIDANIIREAGVFPLAELMKHHPFCYLLIAFMLLGIAGGLLSVMATTFSYFVPSRLSTVMCPFIVSFLSTRILAIFDVPPGFRIEGILRLRYHIKPFSINFLEIVGAVLSILIICFSFSLFAINRWLSHD